ncbi:MAG: right-handed parallel beta-helix repeat-containing protein [Candidatus Binatia bacterium]
MLTFFSDHRAQLLAFVLGLLLIPAVARAKLCGGDVRGHRVPCACGDIVVSDLVLTDDPVASDVCPGDGLVVRAIGAAHGVTVDLRGKTLRGSGRGTGVWILYGGPGGARLVSRGGPGTIAGFRDGVVGHGVDSVVLIDGIIAAGSSRDGVRVEAAGYQIRATEARDSGRDGFFLMGAGFRVTATHAINSGHFGYLIMGEGAVIGAPGSGNTAHGSGEAGFNLTGRQHLLAGCVALDGRKEGVRLNATRSQVIGCIATGNNGDGIIGVNADLRLSGNRAVNNGDNGIVVWGSGVEDHGGNVGHGNRGRHRQNRIDCEIGGRPCRH